MYIQVPPPIQLRDLVSGDLLSEENITDEKGRTYKSLGLSYENKPISMRTWFLRSISQHFKGYEEFKAARRIEKALAKAEKDRAADGLFPVVEISKDDTAMWQQKLKALQLGADAFMQYADFADAVSPASPDNPRGMSEEKPKAELRSVEAPAGG